MALFRSTQNSRSRFQSWGTLPLIFVMPGVIVLLSGCQGISMTGVRETAQVRLVHASPDTPAVDLYAGESALAYSVPFGTHTTYIPVAQGRQWIHADLASSREALTTARAMLAAGGQYTAIVGDSLGSLRLTLLPDQTRAAPPGESALRLVDQAFRAGPLDVYLVPSGRGPAGTPAAAFGMLFGGVEGYKNVPAGSYSFSVVPAGVSATVGSASLLTTPQMAFASGTVRTVILVDRSGTAGGVQAIVNEEGDDSHVE